MEIVSQENNLLTLKGSYGEIRDAEAKLINAGHKDLRWHNYQGLGANKVLVTFSSVLGNLRESAKQLNGKVQPAHKKALVEQN